MVLWYAFIYIWTYIIYTYTYKINWTYEILLYSCKHIIYVTYIIYTKYVYTISFVIYLYFSFFFQLIEFLWSPITLDLANEDPWKLNVLRTDSCSNFCFSLLDYDFLSCNPASLWGESYSLSPWQQVLFSPLCFWIHRSWLEETVGKL